MTFLDDALELQSCLMQMFIFGSLAIDSSAVVINTPTPSVASARAMFLAKTSPAAAKDVSKTKRQSLPV